MRFRWNAELNNSICLKIQWQSGWDSLKTCIDCFQKAKKKPRIYFKIYFSFIIREKICFSYNGST